MPNGRSGGFPIQRDTLFRLLEGFAGDLHVGSMFSGPQRLMSVTVAQLKTLVDTLSGPKIAVEEQDHSSYIIHVQNSPGWVAVGVGGKSPLFPAL